MTGMGERAPLTAGQRWFGAFLVIAGLAITGIAFRVIFDTVTALASRYMTVWPWSVVVSCEIAFVFLFGLGILLAWRKAPSPAIRSIFMGLLIAGSVILNVWAARGSVPDMAAHLVVLCAFFACLLTGKAGFQMLRGSKIRADRIGLGEWISHPVHAARLQRWMLTWGEPSREVAHARYMRLLFAVAVAQSDQAVGNQRAWQRSLPVALRYQIEMGQLPEFTGDDWQQRVAAHVRAQLHPDLPPAPERAPEPAGSVPGGALPDPSHARPRARSEHASRPALKLTAARSRGMTPERLAEHVSAMLGKYGDTVSLNRIKADLSVGTDKAKAALEIARKNRARVVQFAERKQA